MNEREPPSDLGELQRWFSAVLRAPLDPSSMSLAVAPAGWPAEAERLTAPGAHGTVRERLAVYNRQYWFRLFNVFGAELPLVARLLGHFRLNQLAQAFLVEHPPRGVDLGRACDGFDRWLDLALSRGEEPALTPPWPEGLPRELVREALAVDAAYRALWAAPRVPPYRPSDADAARLPTSRLVPSEAVALLDERWPLLDLRRRLPALSGDGPVTPPGVLDSPRAVALVRLTDAIVEVPLEPLQVLLYRELARAPLEVAVGALAERAGAATDLAADVRRWLRWSVEAGLWSGLTP